MSDTPGTSAPHVSPLVAMRRAWRMSAGLMLLGLIAGVGFASTRPVSYQGEARIGVGSQSLGTNAVAGYVLAAQQLAADYARYVTLQTGQAAIAGKLGASAASQVTSITASPIPDSTIIRIDVEAPSKDIALRAVGVVQQTLVSSINASVNATTPAAVLANYNTVNAQLLTAQSTLSSAQEQLAALHNNGASNTAIATQQKAVNAAQNRVDSLNTQATALQTQYQTLLSQPQTANGLRVVTPAVLVGSNHVSLLERYGLLGFAVGALIALVAAVGIDRRWRASKALPASLRLRLVPTPSTPAHPRRRAGDRAAPPTDPASANPVAATPANPTPFARPTVAPNPTPAVPTPEPVTPEPVTPEPVTPEPVTPEPVTPEPVTPEPVTPEPVTPEPVTPEPVVAPNPYLAQALRATREQENRTSSEHEALIRESRRREIRNALQERTREADSRLSEFLSHEEPVGVADPPPQEEAPPDKDSAEPTAAVPARFSAAPTKQIRVQRSATPTPLIDNCGDLHDLEGPRRLDDDLHVGR